MRYNLTKLNLGETKVVSFWDAMPSGWSKEAMISYWDTLVGDKNAKIAQCVTRMEGEIGEPQIFCTYIANKLEGRETLRDDPF